MQIYACDTSSRDEKFRRNKLFLQIPDLDERTLSSLQQDGFFSLPLREGDYPGSLFDFCYSVGYTLEYLTIMNDLQWSRTISPFVVGMFGSLQKLGVKFFPPDLFNDEKTLVNQGLSLCDESRIMVPLANQIFAHAAFALVMDGVNKKE